MVEPLPTDYYRTNFLILIDHAVHHYHDLLNQDEQRWILRFKRSSPHAQCLLVRLLARKGHFFRSDKLNYTEINNIPDAAQELESKDLLLINPDISILELTSELLTKPETLAYFPVLYDHRGLKKAALIEKAVELNVSVPTLEFDIYQVPSHPILDIILVLFFGNTHQDLSQFVLSELGMHRFESYPLPSELRFFNQRAQIDALLAMKSLTEQYYLLKENRLLTGTKLIELSKTLPDESEHHNVERKRQKLINLLARELEREQQYNAAFDLFSQSRLPPSRERQVRILERDDQDSAAAKKINEMLQAPFNQDEYEVAQRLEAKLLRKKGQRVPRTQKPKHNELHLRLDLSQQRVELAVAENFKQQGWQVYFSENQLLCALFGLAFWDVLFTPVQGAFINAYQIQPKDMYYSEFTLRRADSIENTFHLLSKHGFHHLLHTYKQKEGIANSWVQWQHCSKTLIEQAINTIPQKTLIALFRYLLSDLQANRTGMPDLILFKHNQYQWLEVKGPGDKLQNNQLRWIKQFNQLDVPFSVVYVNH
ncbi:VRR-NUC domain-containing protein [Vibrio sp. Of7-15]|uniref:VRR-NUC domain-containing protein n=1 Tax=Vibrio sp. Of7-15 TaxID=2724879 RepID=UPI001EF355D7|nr:VRR-NUC domain-containing protein [Vibrio sp. Of7-15]MCG7496500.1 VRR-NUC domain-containing protein [Vibrio sp. Of7-15]